MNSLQFSQSDHVVMQDEKNKIVETELNEKEKEQGDRSLLVLAARVLGITQQTYLICMYLLVPLALASRALLEYWHHEKKRRRLCQCHWPV